MSKSISDPIVPVPEVPRTLRPVIPTLARRNDFMPEVGGRLTVTIPGETVSAIVEEIHSPDVVTVQLTGMVLGKNGMHTYRTGDILAVKRDVIEGNLMEVWRAIDDREVRMKEQAARLAAAAVKDKS